ncbi:MAG: hypothetical protein WBD20_02830 [Pirellulaceae bacterium]
MVDDSTKKLTAPASTTLLIAALAFQVTFTQTTLQGADPVVNASSIADLNPGDGNEKAKRPALDREIEQRAQALVKQHLPELGKLLSRIQTDNPRQYELAIRDLAKSARRLESAKSRDEELYEIEVELLKSQSSLKLYAAKLKVRDNEDDRQALRKSAQRQLNAEVARAKYNVRILAERAQRAQQQLSAANDKLNSLEENSESLLEKKYVSLLRSVGRKDDDANESRKPKQRSVKPSND